MKKIESPAFTMRAAKELQKCRKEIEETESYLKNYKKLYSDSLDILTELNKKTCAILLKLKKSSTEKDTSKFDKLVEEAATIESRETDANDQAVKCHIKVQDLKKRISLLKEDEEKLKAILTSELHK